MLWERCPQKKRERQTTRSRCWGLATSNECSSPGVVGPDMPVESTRIHLPSRRLGKETAVVTEMGVSRTIVSLPSSLVRPTPSPLRPKGLLPSQLALLCVERMQEPQRLMQVYWMKWRRLGHTKAIFLGLKKIMARAVSERVLHFFLKWRLFAYHAVVVRFLDERVVRDTLLNLARCYWKRWLLFVKLWRKQKVQKVALRQIRSAADRQLLRRQYARWKDVVRLNRLLRQRSVALFAYHTRCLLHRYYLLWLRRRRNSLRVRQLKFIRYQGQRMLAQRTLRRWMLYVSRRIVACNIERLTLEHFVCRFLVQWRRSVYICKSLRRIRHRACWSLARRSFQLWSFWLIRVCFSLRLELRNTALLLHPYFMRWLLLCSVRSLEYGWVGCKAPFQSTV